MGQNNTEAPFLGEAPFLSADLRLPQTHMNYSEPEVSSLMFGFFLSWFHRPTSSKYQLYKSPNIGKRETSNRLLPILT